MFDSIVLDKATGSNRVLERLKLVGELARIKAELGNAGGAVERLRLAARANQIRLSLGASKADEAENAVENERPEAADEAQLSPRIKTSQYYEFDPNRKLSQRKRDNAEAMKLLDIIDAGEVNPDSLTDEQKTVLAKYSGTGGALVGADGKKGSAYEYYTPKPIAEGLWNLMGELGFTGGKVLDPCAGVGIFGATAPLNAAIDAVELNETSGRINQLVNGGTGYNAVISNFEKVAAATPDEQYDAVITNVPFGGKADRGKNYLDDQRYQEEPLQNYFILRSLEKLRQGGLAIFITPPRCVSGKGGKEEDLRRKSCYMAEFLGAYRLPNAVFGTANADTMTDVIAFRKYSKDTQEKIEELRGQSPETLREANVLWDDFIDGRYFDTDGKRFVLGEFVPKDPDKFRDVDRVITTKPIAEIAQMIRKFPDSRVKWELLGASETMPIIYKDGDTIVQAGQTLQMQDGRWVALGKPKKDEDMADLLGRLANPYSAFENKVDYKSLAGFAQYMTDMAQTIEIPGWVRGAVAELKKIKKAGDREKYWNAGVIGMAAMYVFDERSNETPAVNFVEEYKALSDAMQRHAVTAKKRLSSIGGSLREGLDFIGRHYKKKAFSAVWRGDVQEMPSIEVSADGTFEGLRYTTKSKWVSLEEAKKIFGDSFDPFGDSGWCVSSDGKSVTKADDYYIGKYADFIRKVDADIANAADEKVKGKLLRQKMDAEARVEKIDVSKLRFNLFSPLVTVDEKVEFLKRFVDSSAYEAFDERRNKKYADINVRGSNLSDDEKLLNRFGDYMKNGTITLGGIKLDMSDEDALMKLRDMVNQRNEQFNGWVKANRKIMDRIKAAASDPEKLRFKAVDDESPMSIPGLNSEIKLHGYQNAFVRKMGREFGGGNGDGVGLGKTFQGLAAVQYAQSIGIKKKTAFVVPNSVLSNWKKEASAIYSNTEDCLFVGLRVDKNGKAAVRSANFDEDLNKVLENRHSKIFMTMEAFERIKLRDSTVGDYEQFMRSVDASFAESEDKKKDERNKGKQASLLAILSDKKGGAPYLEDMGIDSLVFDEGHMYKNSSQTVDFKGAKYLSLAPASKRGIDAQAKAWFIRGKSELKDGVLVLTATPITNSPLEIYSMLSLAVGHERVNDTCLGIRGSDHFMEMMCVKENQDDVTTDGIPRITDVFTGLDNTDVLRKAIGDVYTARTAQSVGAQIVAPEKEEKATRVTLPPAVVDQLKRYKGAFRYAIDELMKKPNRGNKEDYEWVAEHFGEDIKLIGHPFNLINKMTYLIADPELDSRATFYNFIKPQKDKAEAAIRQFNAKRFIEKRPRPGPMTEESAIVGSELIKDAGTGREVEIKKIAVQARIISEGSIAVDSMDPDVQTAFEKIADSLGLDLDVSVPPKLAAMLENFKDEMANPRGIGSDGKKLPIVKQIIFCDILPLHNKIKRLLAKRAGVSSGKVAIVTGKTNDSPEEIQAVQDGFNASGSDNKYQVIIANEKAEVGINLQKGTQAIHHLTIGWTPDSLEQRNGRGVRQGNMTARINVYYYDAEGTFDEAKRTMVNKKSEWIEKVMDVNGIGRVDVDSCIDNEKLQMLANCIGDDDAIKKAQEEGAAAEAEKRAENNRFNQRTNLETIVAQKRFLELNKTALPLLSTRISTLFAKENEAAKLKARVEKPDQKLNESAIRNYKNQLEVIQDEINEKRKQIEQSIVVTESYWEPGTGSVEKPVNLGRFFDYIRQKNESARNARQKVNAGDVEKMVTESYGRFTFNVSEGSPIYNDWQYEVDVAKGMIEENQASFTQSADAEGAYPANIAEAIVNKEGRMFEGKPLVKGTFFLKDGVLAIADSLFGRNGPDAKGYILNNGELLARRFNTEDIKTAEFICPGMDGYDACITKAAEIEDMLAEKGRVENVFSEIIPEVAQRRKTEIMAAYSYSYRLPAPYFPYVFRPEGIENSEVKRKISDEQKKIISGHDTRRGVFIVKSDVEVVKGQSGMTDEELIGLRDYAAAHNMKLTSGDFEYRPDLYKLIERSIVLADLKAAIAGGTNSEIMEQALAFVKNSTPWFDWASSDFGYDDLPWGLKSAAAEAAKESGASDTQLDPEKPVGITGRTRDWFRSIKAAASFVGSPCLWDSDNKVWNVRRKAWDKLVESYKSAARELYLVDATKRF
ncbi:MAG: N-6 DNA methylase [Alistipes senegalensis]|nr:N-6 DNA methylase [Oxalobacter formigenes]MCM1280896.1 N-6 DNA methylase [Alistipes senegalensis]